jgi:hypothetical protein
MVVAWAGTVVEPEVGLGVAPAPGSGVGSFATPVQAAMKPAPAAAIKARNSLRVNTRPTGKSSLSIELPSKNISLGLVELPQSLRQLNQP